MHLRARVGAVLGAVSLGAGLAVGPALPAAADYEPQEPPLTTPWTADVDPADPRPEYPRPLLVREQWQSLDGVWDYQGAGGPNPTEPGGAAPPDLADLAGRPTEQVLVPFPVTSPLSGIHRKDQVMRYSRIFTVPEGWAGERVQLNFGGVIWLARVSVNGQQLAEHRGSYDEFSVDVTDALLPGGAPNTLTVEVVDPQVANGQPVGKQAPVSALILFTAGSGIWQSVWMEPVPDASIDRVDHRTVPSRDALVVTPEVSGAQDGDEVRVRLLDGEGVTVEPRGGVEIADDADVVAQGAAPAGSDVTLPVADPRLWSPDDPHLYGLAVDLVRDGAVVDTVTSYAGMRTMELGTLEDGKRWPLLNGEPFYQSGLLDHGYWPDGVYAAPTDEALAFDLEEQRRLGFTVNRKHVKVEPQRWYYHADRLGMLVWQDMPNMAIYRPVGPQDMTQFEVELGEMLDEHRSHPSIITWSPLNEGWGQYDVQRITDETIADDPTRLVSGNSGSEQCCTAIEPEGDHYNDTHMYNGPFAPRPDGVKASIIGEMGGLYSRVPEHEWDPAQSLGSDMSAAAGVGIVERQWESLSSQVRTRDLVGHMFTEWTDVEQEIGGFMTYDRQVHKVPPALVERLNDDLVSQAGTVAGRTPLEPALPPGSTASWSFDDEGDDGSTASDGTGDADLTLSGDATRTDGVRGDALLLDGSGDEAAAAGSVLPTTGSFTVSGWLRMDAARQSASAVSQDGSGSAGFSLGSFTTEARTDLLPGYAYAPPDPADGYPYQRWSFDVAREDCASAVPSAPPTSPTEPQAGCYVQSNTAYDDGTYSPEVGQWQHVVGVVDRDTSTTQLYVDGVPVDTRTLEAEIDAAGPFRVGQGQGAYGGDDGFEGAVDELRVYDRALSADEVWQLARFDGLALDDAGGEPEPVVPEAPAAALLPLAALAALGGAVAVRRRRVPA